MKKVLLLGDSIRMGYSEYVKEILKDKCEVYFDANDNGRFAAYTLWQANQIFKNHGEFDVVHWNNGYWDMNVEAPMVDPIHPLDEYLHFLNRIITEIHRNGAKIIFATTVPLLPEDKPVEKGAAIVRLGLRNDWVIKYNEAAKKLMTEHGITINDLYELAIKDENYYKCEDNLHLTQEGYKACAQQVAKMIEEKL